MSLFPGALPVFAGFTSSHTLATDNHAAQHNLEQAEVVQIATKIGTGASTPVAGTVLRSTGAGVSSWGQVALTTDVSGILPIANGGTNASTAAAARTSLGATSLADVYPIGCIYTETTGINPNTTFGFGTWATFGAGRVLVGVGTSDQIFAAGATGGESTHVLTTAEMPSHVHTNYGRVAGASGAATRELTDLANGSNNVDSGSAGSNSAHNNLQPYIVVYFWQRIA